MSFGVFLAPVRVPPILLLALPVLEMLGRGVVRPTSRLMLGMVSDICPECSRIRVFELSGNLWDLEAAPPLVFIVLLGRKMLNWAADFWRT